MKLVATVYATSAFSAIAACAVAASADEAAELAKKLSNPVASLISVPIEWNYDENLGPNEDGSLVSVKAQPVIPMSISEDWNLISRTILTFVDQDDVPLPGAGESGLADTVQSFFFSPKEPTDSGWIWGAGPVFLLPTASDDALGAEKWGIGPTAVFLKQQGPWTYGVLTNHLESFAGDDDRADASATFVQLFTSYIYNKTKTTFSLSTEATYDWEADEASIPVNLQVKQLLKLGDQILQAGVGVRYWADSTPNGPDGWGFRASLTFLFPK